MQKFSFLILVALCFITIASAEAKDPSSYSFDASEMAHKNREQVIKFINVDVLLDKGKIIVIPKSPRKGGGMLRPNDVPNFPPPPPPIPLPGICQSMTVYSGSSGDDNFEGPPNTINIFYGNGGNDTLIGGECDDLFYTYDLMNPAENKGTSTVTGNGGSDTLNTQRLFKATFTDYDASKDVINIIP